MIIVFDKNLPVKIKISLTSRLMASSIPFVEKNIFANLTFIIIKYQNLSQKNDTMYICGLIYTVDK